MPEFPALTFLPIVQRELGVAARKPTTYRLRVATAAIAVLPLAYALIWRAIGGSRVSIFPAETQAAGLVAALCGILFTIDSLSFERREGTLGLLFLTPLRAYDIVAGKLVSAGVYAGGSLLALLPIFGLVWLVGGVTAAEFSRAGLAIANILWFSLTLGVTISTFVRSAAAALGAGAVAIVALLVGLPLLKGSVGGAWVSVNPMTALGLTSDLATSASPGEFWSAIVLSHGVGWALVGLASWQLPRSWRDQPREHRRVAGGPGPNPIRDGNPIAILATPPLTVKWIGGAVVALAVLQAMVQFFLGGANLQVTGVGMFLGGIGFASTAGAAIGWLVLRVLFAWNGIQFFSRLRQDLAELLLTTPIQDSAIREGVSMAFYRTFRFHIYVLMILETIPVFAMAFQSDPPAPSQGILTSLGYRSDVILPLLGSSVLLGYRFLTFWTDFAGLSKMAMYHGLRERTTGVALAKTIGIALGWRALIPCLPNLLVSSYYVRAYENKCSSGIRRLLIADRTSPSRWDGFNPPKAAPPPLN